MTEKLLNHHAEGPTSAPALLLGPSLGTSYALWDEVAELDDTARGAGGFGSTGGHARLG